MPPPQIILNAAELQIVDLMATHLQTDSVARGFANHRHGPQSDLQIHRIGYGGELAFCKILNLYPDFTLEPRCGQPDFSRFGQTIEVRTTAHRQGRLMARKLDGIDLYALVTVPDWPTFNFIGFARRDQILRAENLTDFGNGKPPAYALRQSALTPEQLKLWE